MSMSKEQAVDYLWGIYKGAHSQSDAVHPEVDEQGYLKDHIQLECHFDWCWPQFQTILALIEHAPEVDMKFVEKWSKRVVVKEVIVNYKGRIYAEPKYIITMLTEAGVTVTGEGTGG